MLCRCLAHIVHLAAKHIVEAFTQDGPVMESELPMDDFQTDAVDDDSETSYTSGDALGKLWAFINQVRDCLLRMRWAILCSPCWASTMRWGRERVRMGPSRDMDTAACYRWWTRTQYSARTRLLVWAIANNGSGLTFSASDHILLQVLCRGEFALSRPHQIRPNTLVLDV
jgi:hypothetical protein